MPDCPICYTPLNAGISGWTDDPMKTPNHFIPELRGEVILRVQHITEIRTVLNHYETQLSMTLTQWTPIDPAKFEVRPQYINEMRESIEGILNKVGVSLADWLSWDETKTPVLGITDWLNGHRLTKNTPVRGMHIEEVRKILMIVPSPVRPFWCIEVKTSVCTMASIGEGLWGITQIDGSFHTTLPGGSVDDFFCSGDNGEDFIIVDDTHFKAALTQPWNHFSQPYYLRIGEYIDLSHQAIIGIAPRGYSYLYKVQDGLNWTSGGQMIIVYSPIAVNPWFFWKMTLVSIGSYTINQLIAQAAADHSIEYYRLGTYDFGNVRIGEAENLGYAGLIYFEQLVPDPLPLPLSYFTPTIIKVEVYRDYAHTDFVDMWNQEISFELSI